MGNGTRIDERGGDARARLLAEIRERRRLRARRDRAGMRRAIKVGAFAIVVVASCSMLPKDLRASTTHTVAPAAAPADSYAPLPFVGDVRHKLSAMLLATAPHVPPPEYATAWKY